MNREPMQDYVVRVVHKECAPERRPGLYSSARFSRREALLLEGQSRVGTGAAGFSLHFSGNFFLVISWVEGR